MTELVFLTHRLSLLGLGLPILPLSLPMWIIERTESQRDLEVYMFILGVGEDISLNIGYCTKCRRVGTHKNLPSELFLQFIDQKN